MDTPLLDIRGLRAQYEERGMLIRRNSITILDGFDLAVRERETLGLVGESGSGKTTLIQTILGLVKPVAGSILIDGKPLARDGQTRSAVQVVFQNPFSSLDPHLSVLDIVAEPLIVHGAGSGAQRRTTVIQLLDEVGLSSRFITAYPHELSGGQAQRVALARALALRPKLLLLDEPTSSLDVSVQAQVLNLLLELQARLGLTYLFVTHDLAVVQHISDRIAVMYLGQIVELGPTEKVFSAPAHPYTQALLAASGHGQSGAGVIGTAMPRFTDPPSGCRFHTRCPLVMDVCRTTEPAIVAVGGDWTSKCHLVAAAPASGSDAGANPPDTEREAVNG